MSAAKSTRSEAVEQQKKVIAGAVFAVIVAGVLYFELSDPSPKTAAPPAPALVTSSTPAAAATRSGTAARNLGSTSAALDPTLHMQAMLVTESVVYTGSGRNIFAGPSYVPPVSTTAIPKPLSSARTQPSVPANLLPSGPPGLPPIDLKFFGTVTDANAHRQAFLLHGDDVFLASNGDIVQRKYRIVNVGANSIQVEDLTNSNKQTLPLLVNR